MAGEIASAFVSIVPSFQGQGSVLSRQLSGDAGIAGDAAGRTAGSKFSSGLGGALKGVGGIIAGAFVVDKAVDFFKGAISGASDLNETISKATVIFGDQSGVIRDWAKGAATNMGLSQQAALDAAAGFGDMFSQIGFSGDEAAKLSQSTVQLSADLGSFNNLPTEDVASRISAAFRGEYDSLQTLIPNINAARVQTEALAMTGKKNASELTAQEKAAAVLAIVNHDGARAIGDFARTSAGAANTSKILSARFADIKTRVGQALLPAFTKVLGIGAKILDFLSTGGDKTSAFGKILTTAGEVIKTVFAGVKEFIADNRATFEAWWAKLKEIFTQLVTTVMVIWESVVAIWKEHGDTIIATLQVLWAVVKNTFETIMGVISAAFDVISGLVKVFTGLLTGDWSKAWEGIKQIFSGVWDAIKAILSGAWGEIKILMAAAWDSVKAIVGTKVGELVTFVTGIPGKITTALGNLLTLLTQKGTDLVTGFFTAIILKYEDVKTWLFELPGKVLGYLGSLLGVLVQAGKDLITGLINGIDSAIPALIDKLQWVTSHFVIWKGPPGTDAKLLSGTGRLIMQGLEDGLRSQFPSVQRFLEDATSGIGGGFDVRVPRGLSGPRLSRPDSGGTATAVASGPQVVHIGNWPDIPSRATLAESSATVGRLVGAF